MDLKKKILLVEDEALIAFSEAACLRKHGYEVLTVSNGQAAIAAAEKDPSINLILMDIDLGEGMDGTEAAIRILKKRDIPILFLSGHNEPEIVDRTYQIGAYGYILKNAGETVLLASLRMAFKLYKTHRRQQETEKKLRELQECYESVIRKVPVSVFVVQDRKYVFTNECGATLLGYRIPEEVVGIPVEETVDPTHLKDIWSQTDATPESMSNASQRFQIFRKDGHVIWVESVAIPIVYKDLPSTLLIMRDITQMVAVEKNLQKETQLHSSRYALLEHSFSHDLPDILRKIIDTVCDLTGSPLGFFHFLKNAPMRNRTVQLHAWSTSTIEKYCKIQEHPSHYPLEQAGIWADCARIMKPVIHNDYPSIENRKGYPEGHPHLIRELTVPVIRDNLCVAILGVGNKSSLYTEEDVEIAMRFSDLAWDIVERKRSEQSLQESEEEQRSLLKELRHRTKNTFHQILSLASLQVNQETEPQTKEALLDMRNRVSVLAGLYETLQIEETRTVSLKGLIQRVCSSLAEAFAFRTKQDLTYEAEPISLDSRSASAFGLILNELITNAYKHAFPDGRKGTIHVSLVKKEDRAILTVEDDGVGFDSTARDTSVGHFGLELIDALVNQLGATFQIQSRTGTRATLTIPLPVSGV